MTSVGIEIGETTSRMASCSGGATRIIANSSHGLETPSCCFVDGSGGVTPGFCPSRPLKPNEQMIERVLLQLEKPEYGIALLQRLFETAAQKANATPAEVVVALPDWLLGQWKSRVSAVELNGSKITVVPRSAAAFVRHNSSTEILVAALDVSESHSTAVMLAVSPSGILEGTVTECGEGANNLFKEVAQEVFNIYASANQLKGSLSEKSAADLAQAMPRIVRGLANGPTAEFSMANLTLDDQKRFDIDIDIQRSAIEPVIRRFVEPLADSFAKLFQAADSKAAVAVMSGVLGAWRCAGEVLSERLGIQAVVADAEDAARGASALATGSVTNTTVRKAKAPVQEPAAVAESEIPQPEEKPVVEIPASEEPVVEAHSPEEPVIEVQVPEEPAVEVQVPAPEPELPAIEEAQSAPEQSAAEAPSKQSPAPEEPEDKKPEPIPQKPIRVIPDYKPVGSRAPRGLGFETVVEAQDTGGRRLVMRLVELPFDKLGEDRVRRIASRLEAMKRVTSPNTVGIIDITFVPTGAQYLEENGDWPTLRDVLLRKRKLAEDEVAGLAAGLASSLEYLRSADVFHRNIRPENVLYRVDTREVRLRGFDLAVHLSGNSKMSGQAGALPYVAPEVLGDGSDARADIYSAGIVIFEALTGCLPFQAPNMEEMKQMILSQPIPPPSKFNPSVSHAADELILKATARSPEDRVLEADSAKRLLNGKSG